jgi:hypothetical protein
VSYYSGSPAKKSINKAAAGPQVHSYSAVKYHSGVKTGPEAILHERVIRSLVNFEVATDYSVKATAIDLVRAVPKVVAITAKQFYRVVTPETSSQALKLVQDEGDKVIENLDVERSSRSCERPSPRSKQGNRKGLATCYIFPVV